MYMKNIENWQVISADLKQTFQNKFTNNVDNKSVIKMKNDGDITDRDLEISKFLFKFRFATLAQIHKFLGQGSSANSLKSRLEKLVQYRILNKFMLGEEEEDHLYPDAFAVYCLDLGGKYLLTHYSNEDTSDWYVITNMKASEIISKDILATEFYLRIKETCSDKLVYFNLNPELRVARKNVVPSFEMCLKINGQNRYFIGEITRQYDFPLNFRQKAEKIENLLITNAWKKYYYDSDSEPILFIFAENDMVAKESGKVLSETTSIQNFRISTDERIQKVLFETGAFLKYMPELQALKEIKAVTFKPEQ